MLEAKVCIFKSIFIGLFGWYVRNQYHECFVHDMSELESNNELWKNYFVSVSHILIEYQSFIYTYSFLLISIGFKKP